MNNKILIYGGSGGVGSALAKKLVTNGNDVHIAGKNEETLTALAEELSCGFTIGNVSDENFFTTAAAEAGDNVSSVVYAIGTINLKSISRLTTDDFLNDYSVNVIGAFHSVKASINSLKANKGSVLFYSSVAAQIGFPMHASIGGAKGAIDGLTLSLAAELSPFVRVNAIAPSLTDTPLASRVLANDTVKETIGKMHPLKRLGTPEDIANLSAYLLSNEASWVTGQIFGLDGGRSGVASM